MVIFFPVWNEVHCLVRRSRWHWYLRPLRSRWIEAIRLISFFVAFLAVSIAFVSAADARSCGSNDTVGREGRPASAASTDWADYQIIIWQAQSSARLAGLARLGITAGMILGERKRLDRTLIPQ